MAAELTQDAVLCFLQSRGGSVTNAELLLHFRPFLREHADQSRNREMFKRFVNSVARVKQEDGVSYVVLQRKFRGPGTVPGTVPGTGPGTGHAAGHALSGQSKRAYPGVSTPGNLHLSMLWNADKPLNNKRLQPGATPVRPVVLPAAGIILHNSVEPNLKLPQGKVQQSPVCGASPAPVALMVPTSQALPDPAPPQGRTGLPHAPARIEAKVAPVTLEPCREPSPVPVCSDRPAAQPLSFPRNSAPPCSSVNPGLAPDVPGQGEASVRPVERVLCAAPLRGAPRKARLRQSYRSAVSVEEDGDEDEEVAPGRRVSLFESAAGQDETTVGMQGRVMSQSTPALDTAPVRIRAPETNARSLEERHVTGLPAPPAVWPQKVSPVRTVPQIHIQDLDPSPRRGSDPEPRSRRTSSPLTPRHLHGSGCSVEQSPQGSAWSSCEELSHRGDLYDDKEGTSDGSTTPPAQLRPSVSQRRCSKLRSRMCLSVGADLDQIMDEEDHRALGGSEAARLHRLHLISSSLSLRHMSSSSLSSCSTPPRCHSLADLTDRETQMERTSVSSMHHQEGHSRQSQLPLEEREHLWLVKAAAGTWPDIYSLFREDSSLLQRRDFISGFTVLHWIAKHGDHRVLNTLWYGVEKAGLKFDTNTQSSCGYTPLHIAAIHNHKNIIRLLVNKFGASVNLRDAAGKKAWSYLPQEAPVDLFQLLGAPAKAALGQTRVAQMLASPQTRQQSQKRRRRHHFSSASGQRPAGEAKVKRTSSLAFLKQKALQKVKAEWAI